MSAEKGFGRYGWRDDEKFLSSLDRWGTTARTSPHPSPRRISPSPMILMSPNLPPRRKSQWKISAIIRKKFERNSGRVGTSGEFNLQSRVPQSHDPYLKTLHRSSFRSSLESQSRYPSPYSEPEIYDVGIFREPRYLDLFEPGVQVVRDPKLTQAPRSLRQRVQPIVKGSVGFLSSTRAIVGGSVALLILVLVIVSIVAVKMNSLPSRDPRISYMSVMTATSCGLVKGLIEEKAFVFRGIPYALAPIRNHRLKFAQPLNSLHRCWSGNYTANIKRQCWTYSSQGETVPGHEDCLLLDIYTPKLGYENPLPVIIYVGGSSVGSDERKTYLLANSPKLVRSKNVVIVSPQIRRGALGFLPSPIVASSVYPHTSGNQGVSDLVVALRWIHQNIEHFGGDNKKMTVLGHEVGASILWPLIPKLHSEGLVYAAWLTGAAPINPVLSWREANPALSYSINCTSIVCLQSVSAEELMESAPLAWRKSFGRPWIVADGVLASFESKVPRLPIMFGTTEQSAAENLLPWRLKINSEKELTESVFEILREREKFNLDSPVQRTYPTDDEELFSSADASAAIRRYSYMEKNPWLLLATLISDVITTCPLLNTARFTARNWAYSLPSSREFSPPIYAYNSKYKRKSLLGNLADSRSDIEAIFGVYRPKSKADKMFVKEMQNLFFTFVETGRPERYNPTPAHYGTYVLRENIIIEKSNPSCSYWTNITHLLRRF